MGVSDLRDKFNSIAGPAITCTVALLSYERAHDTEWQILVFRGTDAAGEPFEVKSDPVKPHGDIMEETAKTAQRLIDLTTAAPAAPPAQ